MGAVKIMGSKKLGGKLCDGKRAERTKRTPPRKCSGLGFLAAAVTGDSLNGGKSTTPRTSEGRPRGETVRGRPSSQRKVVDNFLRRGCAGRPLTKGKARRGEGKGKQAKRQAKEAKAEDPNAQAPALGINPRQSAKIAAMLNLARFLPF